LYGVARHRLWPVEAVYAVVEVKTSLDPSNIQDAIEKCRRFKSMPRRFCEAGRNQRTTDSLFVIWAFDCPAPATIKANLLGAIEGVPRVEQPDLIVVPDKIVAQSGVYLETVRLGQPGSQYRQALELLGQNAFEQLLPEAIEVMDLGSNSLLAWFTWFDSWLRQAGDRLVDPISYLPPDAVFGRKVP